MDINIIFEDEDIVVVEKPPGMPCQRDKTGDLDLMTALDRDYLGLVHRLDRPVGGVMVYARKESSNTWLSKGIRDRAFHKEYLAVVIGRPSEEKGQMVDQLKKLRTVNMSKVVSEDVSGSKKAILEYRLLQSVETEEHGALSLVHIVLLTGRHHQIRVQLSNAGLPLWGDTKYNGAFTNRKDWTQVSLWSHRIKFRHPGGRKVSYHSLPEDAYPWNLFEMPEIK
ncbi:MAG TPA: RluA family pseudouridine synthase [Tissierellaceae bacterium]|nr:RluA family pseudouridine synthase [Tissierellaceae bacterium]